MSSERGKLAFSCVNLVGRTVQVQTTSGVVYEGICHAIDLAAGKDSLGVALKKAYKKTAASADKPFSGDPEPPSRDRILHELMIKGSDVAQISAVGIDLGFKPPPPPGSAGSDGFTDTGISGGHGGRFKERELEAWVGDPSMDVDLNTSGQRQQGGRNGGSYWSAEAMFAKNKKDHGYEGTWNEDEYTTKLDKSDPEFLRKQATAARLAREIQSGDGTAANSNIHVQMDRGGGIGSNVSEDQLFSAVQPVGKPGKSSYQPPFRRGPNDQVGVPKKSSGPRAPPPGMENVKRPQPSGKRGQTPDPASLAGERSLGPDVPVSSKADLKAFSDNFKIADPKPAESAAAEGGGMSEGKKTDGKKTDFKLRATAPEFSFNPGAAEFTLKPAAAAAAPPPVQMVAPQQGSMMQQQQHQLLLQQQYQYAQQQQYMYQMRIQAQQAQVSGASLYTQGSRQSFPQQPVMMMAPMPGYGQPGYAHMVSSTSARGSFVMQPGQGGPGQQPSQQSGGQGQ